MVSASFHKGIRVFILFVLWVPLIMTIIPIFNLESGPFDIGMVLALSYIVLRTPLEYTK